MVGMKDIDVFQEACERTANGLDERERLANFGMGLAGEAGEVVEILKKGLWHGKPIDRLRVTEELGDVLFYVAVLATTLNIPLSQIAALNVAKLQARYPHGFPAGGAK